MQPESTFGYTVCSLKPLGMHWTRLDSLAFTLPERQLYDAVIPYSLYSTLEK